VEPPLDAGAVKETVAVVDPVAVAAPIIGAPGTVVQLLLSLPRSPVLVKSAAPQ